MTSQNKSDMTNCARSASVWSFSGPHFPPFVLNTKRYSVSPHIQSKCGKMRTGITPNTDTLYAVTVREDVHVDLKIPIAATLCESVKLGPYLEGFFFFEGKRLIYVYF